MEKCQKQEFANVKKKKRLVRAYISKNMELQGVDEENVALKIRVTKRTFQNKRKRPETFTLDELWDLCEALKFTDDEKAAVL